MHGREAAPTVSDADETGAYVAAAKKEAAAAAAAAKRRSAPPPRTTTRRQSVEVQARLLGEGGGKNHAKARLQQQHEARAAERAEKLRVALAKPCDEMAVVGIIGRATAESLASMQAAFIADGGPPLAKALSIGLSDSRKELKAMLESLVRALTHEAHTAEFESSGGDDDGDDDLEDNPAYADELATRVGEGHVLLRREIRALKRVAGTAAGAAAGEARARERAAGLAAAAAAEDREGFAAAATAALGDSSADETAALKAAYRAEVGVPSRCPWRRCSTLTLTSR